MQKERITITMDPDLVARIDRLAEIREFSRSRLIEILLTTAVEDNEAALEQLASPVLGLVVQSVMEHPKLVAMIAKAIGEKIDPKKYAELELAATKVRRARERLKDERGRRHDLRPEGAQ